MQLRKKPDFPLDCSTNDQERKVENRRWGVGEEGKSPTRHSPLTTPPQPSLDSLVEQRVKADGFQVNGEVVQLPPKTVPDTPNEKPEYFPVWRVLFITTVIVGVVVTSLPSLLSCATKGKQAEGKQNVGAMNRVQQVYYSENSAFSNSFDALGLGLQTQTVNYQYSTRATKNAAFNYAIARKGTKAIRSYVGAVFPVSATNSHPKADNKEILTVGILCETLRPSQTRPTDPTLVKGVPTCGSDTKDISPKSGI